VNASLNLSPVSNLSSASKVSSRGFRRNLWNLSLRAICMFVLVLLVSSAAYAAIDTVTNLNDSGTGSLRATIASASSGDTINFASNVIGTITLASSLTINQSVTVLGPGAGLLTISGNNAVTVFTVNSGTVTIAGLTIANGMSNSSASGISNEGTLTTIDCAFANNTGGNGGGIINGLSGTLTVTNGTFYGNSDTAGIGGGGILNVGTLTVSGSTFTGNSGANGGGIFNNMGNATVNNSTFYGNIAAYKGGGIENDGTMTVINNTISGNTSGGVGGGIDGDVGTLTLTNSIVAGNMGGDCNNCGTPPSNNRIGGDPKLGPLQYNGGITQTMMPLPGSPAIGAGLSSTLTTDQRGFARPTGSGVASDLGAVQTNYLTVTNLNDSAAGSLRDAMATAISDGYGDIIFQSGVTGTITLQNGALPSIFGNVNIAGPGANLLTVSGNNSNVVFVIGGSSAVVNLRGLTIANGSAPGSAGGLSNSGLLLIEDCAFVTNNGGPGSGGAMFNNNTLIVENSTFSGNSANDGGGIYNQNTLLVENSTFSGNSASGNGGGIENSGNGTAIVADSTFTGNTATTGGGMDDIPGSTLTVTNSIVSGNTATTGADCNNCTLNSPNLIGSTPNPNLSPLQYNGLNATVQTMLPLPGSPAIQAGDPTQLSAGLLTDERGFPRLTGGKLDQGAAQTNYTAVQFVQQPTDALINADISPAVTMQVLETNTNLTAPNNTDPVSGIPITLTQSGSGTLNGTLTRTTTGGVATFGDLTIDTPNPGDTLTTSLTVVAGQTPLTATSGPFNITLPIPTVSFSPGLPPATATYGDAPLTLKATVDYSSTATGQTLSFQVISGPATVSGNVLTITGAGTVVVEVDAVPNSSYGVASAQASIVVSQATLTVTATDVTRAYGAANPTFTGAVTGAVNRDTFTVSGTTTATPTSAVGLYPITPMATGTNLADYTVAPVNGVLTVSAATPTVSFTALPTSATYGQQINLSATATLSGTSTGQIPRYQVNSGPATINGNVLTITGVQPVQVEAFVAQSGNYSAANTTANITVTSTPLTLTITSTSRAYGDPNNPVFTATPVGLVNGDTLPGVVNYSTTATPTSPIGNYPVTATLLGASANNYTLTVVPGMLTITKAVLTVTGDQQRRPYGTPNPTFYVNVTGQWNNDAFTVSYATTATQTSPVGTYAVVPTVAGANLADYTVVTTNGSFEIIQENLSVVAADATRVYGTPNPAFTATVTGAVNGDTFTPTFTTVGQQYTDVGRYDILPAVTSADIANYAVIPTVGILTITQAATSLALTASANNAAPGSSVTLTATATTAASGPPTGTVVFLANNTAIGSAQLNAQGVATLPLTYLPSGSNTITATYPQTMDFLGSTAQLTAPVLVGTPTFTMTTGTLSMAIQPGQEGSMTLTMTPQYGYAGTVSFGCTGLPAKSLCAFGPSSVTFDGSGTPVQVTLLMEIGELGLVKTSNTARLEPLHPLRGLPLLPAIIFWMPGAGLALEDKRKPSKRKSKSGRMALLIALLAISAGVLGLTGCAGMSPYNNNPRPGQQTVTITATGSGGIIQSVAVQVIVE
jgi:hypothetical protein